MPRLVYNQIETALPLKDYVKDSKSLSEEILVPDDVVSVEIRAKRNAWEVAAKNIVSLTVDLYVGGNWRNGFCGLRADGGILYDKEEILNYSWINNPLPAGKGRKIRVNMEPKEKINTIVEILFLK